MQSQTEHVKLKQASKLTRHEAADRLRVHADTLDRWAEAGLIRPMRYPSPNGGRPTIRYSLAEIDASSVKLSRAKEHVSWLNVERIMRDQNRESAQMAAINAVLK